MGIKNDALLMDAVAYAQAVLETTTAAKNIGEHVEAIAEAPRSATHYFKCLLPAYPGWLWAVVLSRHARSKEILVTETELVAGPGSLLAPDWVPWSQRVDAPTSEEASTIVAVDDQINTVQ